MRVDVLPTIAEVEVESADLSRKTVIIIDVFRATSCIVTAIAGDCSSVQSVRSVSEALAYREDDVILAGERKCLPIDGFDMGNSPSEIWRSSITQKNIVLTTTNGTRGIDTCKHAKNLFCAAFLNSRSCAQAALAANRDIVIVCSGTQDQFSLEDGLCAGSLMEHLITEPISCNDFAKTMLYAFQNVKSNLKDTLKQCTNGQKLIRLGHENDIDFCSELNRFEVIPYLKEHRIIGV